MIRKIKRRERLVLFELVSKEVGITGIVFVIGSLHKVGIIFGKIGTFRSGLELRSIGSFFKGLVLGIVLGFNSFNVVESNLIGSRDFGLIVLSGNLRDNDFLGLIVIVPVKIADQHGAIADFSDVAVLIGRGAGATSKVHSIGILIKSDIDLAKGASGSALNAGESIAKAVRVGTDESVEGKRDFVRHRMNSKRERELYHRDTYTI
tara:strand:- start:104 stop:721 length:618 start_codon:yes stop_codon:yes gene_type:complete